MIFIWWMSKDRNRSIPRTQVYFLYSADDCFITSSYTLVVTGFKTMVLLKLWWPFE